MAMIAEEVGMKAIVVYDSKFGNCKKVAEDVAGGLAEAGVEVNLVQVKGASTGALGGYDVIAIGAPVRAGKPLKSIRKFVKNMQDVSLEGKTLGFFDTYGVAKQPGAGSGYLVLLAKEHPGGAKVVEPGLSVLVKGMKGPLEDGAMEKAREFGKKLAEEAGK